MSSEAPAMNAKARRKLLRQQKQQQQETAAAAAAAAASKQVESSVQPEATATDDAKQPSATERAAETQEESAPTAAEAGERLNAKQRRMLARQAAGKSKNASQSQSPNPSQSKSKSKKRQRSAEPSADAGVEDVEAEESGKPRKRIHLTLFVGQLPFNATEAQVRAHFSEAGDVALRMLTDKKTRKFKGTAFLEVKDSKALGAALARHHSLLNGRRINVELTASGGGNKSALRRAKIDRLREKQSSVQIDKARALLQKRAAAPESKVTPEDIDDRVVDFLSWFDYETAKRALDEFDRCVSDRVQNRKAFFMGILKRFVQTDGDE